MFGMRHDDVLDTRSLGSLDKVKAFSNRKVTRAEYAAGRCDKVENS